MSEFERLTPYAWSFFEKHPIFEKIATGCGDNRYFLTGGTGLFGTWMLLFFDWCHERGLSEPRTTILTRRDVLPTRKYISCVYGTTESFDHPDGVFDRLIHLAAPSARDTFGGMSDRAKFEQMYVGTKNILEFASSKITGRSLFTSSGAVYGGFPEADGGLINEMNRLAPLSITPGIGLGLGKRVTEFLVSDYVRDGAVNAGLARCFSFIGPGLPTDLHYAVGDFVGKAIAGEDIKINGDGSPIRSFMDLGDAVYWLMTILEQGDAGDDFNVGSSQAITIYELAQMVRDIVNPDIKITVKQGSNVSPGNPVNYFYVPDTSKIRDKLEVEELATLTESIYNYTRFLSGQ